MPTKDKVASIGEAVARHVGDSDSVVLGACLEANIPFAITYEIIRQGRRDLNIIAPISDASTDMLIGAGCVGQVTGAWVGNVSGGLGHNYRRAAERAEPRAITIRDHSNFSLSMALIAGAYGMPYVPLRSLLGSDILRSNPEFQMSRNPLAAEKEPVVLVPPLRPDVAVIAVQRADAAGNSHLWGSFGVAQEAALAADRVIVLADALVDAEVIRSDPSRVLFPGYRVVAVCHAPGGVHPAPMVGCCQRDTAFFNDYHVRSRTVDGFQGWLQEWVFGIADHNAYTAKLGPQGEALRIRAAAPAEPANYAIQ